MQIVFPVNMNFSSRTGNLMYMTCVTPCNVDVPVNAKFTGTSTFTNVFPVNMNFSSSTGNNMYMTCLTPCNVDVPVNAKFGGA